jgi:hypothetical protein
MLPASFRSNGSENTVRRVEKTVGSAARWASCPPPLRCSRKPVQTRAAATQLNCRWHLSPALLAAIALAGRIRPVVMHCCFRAVAWCRSLLVGRRRRYAHTGHALESASENRVITPQASSVRIICADET